MSSEAKIKNKKTIKKKIIIGSIIVGLIIAGGTMMLKDNNGVSEEIDIAPELYSVPGREKIFVNGKVIPVQSKDLSIDGDMGELDKINVDNGVNLALKLIKEIFLTLLIAVIIVSILMIPAVKAFGAELQGIEEPCGLSAAEQKSQYKHFRLQNGKWRYNCIIRSPPMRL